MAWLSIVCAATAMLVWTANVVEVRLFPFGVCTLGRMQFESYLFVARVAAVLLPVVGIALGVLAWRAGRLRTMALAINLGALCVTLAIVRGVLPIGHLPCLRT